MRVCVGGGGHVGLDRGEQSRRRWIRKEDAAPLLSLPHLNPLREVGAHKFPSACALLPALSRDPFNLQVLQAFVDCHEFANLNLVQALR